MSETHIINILESNPFGSLSDAELTTIRMHTASCEGCAKAYDVAMVSTSLLKRRAAEAIEPPPFFHTKVLAAIRERQGEGPALLRMWRAAGALVSSMAAAVVLLGALSFMIPEIQPEVSASAYSAEEVILDQNEMIQDQSSDAQVLTVLYDTEEDAR